MNGNGAADALPIPTSIDGVEDVDVDYDSLETVGVVGRGSNATVSEARVADRRVALKEPSVEDETVADRFVREARTWERVADHDHVVDVVDWGPGDGADGAEGPWLALEFMDGGDLRDRDHHSQGQALWIGRCVADAVAHAHERGVVHLDLTPNNVLFRGVEDGWDVPKVGDWGLARLVDEHADADGVTPPYAAPEQFDGAALDERTDVYQLGAVLYRLLTGEAPYSGAPSAVEAAVVEGDPPTPTAVDPGLPDGVDAVVGRAMATDPDDRYETAAALRAEVDDLLAAVLEDADDAGGTTAAALESQGFDRLTGEYFEGREPAPPTEAWRAGLDLVDVHEGYAVEREVERDGERVPPAERLRERLAEGETVAVVGPPGAGKSTVCKQVACAWHEAGAGPVLYRESGQGRRFDAPATLGRYLGEIEGHALVVVEDAVRGEASAIFDAVDAVERDAAVSVLLDARREEWEDADVVLDRERERVRQRMVTVESVPPPDRTEYERFVAAVERSAGTDLDVAVEDLVPEIRGKAAGDQRHPGELFLLLHRLLSHLDLHGTDGDDVATTLDEAVDATRLALERRGETFLDVGVAANLLNAAGVGVYPELLHAVAPDEQTAVAEAIDALDGRVLFTGDEAGPGDGPYRAVHEVWSAEFLANVLDAEGGDAAHERFGGVLSRVLALADDAERRGDVAWALRGETAYLERIAEGPGDWADAVVEDVFELGTEWPKLAPLFGTTEASAIALPAACSDAVRVRRFEWLGEMYRGASDFEESERAYDRLGELAEAGRTGDADDELLRLRALLGTATVHWHRSENDDAIETVEAGLELAPDDVPERCRLLDVEAKARLSQDDYESARETAARQRDLASALDARTSELEALRNLGDVFVSTGEYDQASQYLEEALSVARDVGLRTAEGLCVETLGRIAFRRGNYEQATDCFRQSLTRFREVGHRSGESKALTALGAAAFRRGNPDQAEQYYRESLEIGRDIGQPKSVASSYNNLGVVADKQGEHGRAREYYRQSLEIEREIGDRRGEASSLGNIASAYVAEGAFERAREYYRESLAIKRDIGDRNGEAVTLANLGAVAVSLGDYDRATERLEASLDIAREVGVPHSEIRALLNLGKAAIRQAEYDRGSEYLERGLTLAEEIGDPEQKADFLTFLGEATLLGNGAHERALERTMEARDIARDLEMPKKQYVSLHVLGEIERRRGNLESARQYLAEAVAILDEHQTPFVHGQVRLELGRVRLAAGALDAARDEAERAAEIFEDLETVHWGARTRALLGRIDAATGDRDGARERWRTALETFEAVGAPQDALATLEDLVETCRGVGEEEAAREWCERARDVLTDAPETVVDRHREWIADHAADLDAA